MSGAKGAVDALKEIEVMPRTLAAKILQVSKIIGKIEKAKSPTGGVNFAYQGWDAVMPAVRNACMDVGISLVPSFTLLSADREEKNGKLWTFIYVSMSLLIKDAETGEELTMTFVGESAGVDDKGVQKAITSATKYAYLKLFQIPTVDDAKDDPDGHAPPADAPKKPGADKSLKPKYDAAIAVIEPTAAWLKDFIAQHGKDRAPVLVIEAHERGCKTQAAIDHYLATGEVPS